MACEIFFLWTSLMELGITFDSFKIGLGHG
jgi:hypothetical protein